MLCMFRKAILPVLMVSATAAFAQVPPGDPYNPAKHPNAIITYVDNNAFTPATFAQAQEALGGEMLGLGRADGVRETLSMAPGSVRKVRILNQNTDVTYYPVIRQVYKLTKGSTLTLHSFKNPKAAIPSQIATQVLNDAAFRKPRTPKDARFGANAPEKLDVRGLAALLFETDGLLVVFWQERGICHTVTTDVSRREVFRLIEELL